MATDPQLPIQQAVFNLLSADATLGALVTGVYDFVPEGTSYPYANLGDDIVTNWSSHTFDGASVDLTIHSWAQEFGRKTVKSIMAQIYTLLHGVALSVTGFTCVSCLLDHEQSFLDPDGETYHGVQRFKILIGGN